MIKWEYKEVYHYDGRWEVSLNELGAEGWEAFAHIQLESVSTGGIRYSPAERLLFKRPEDFLNSSNKELKE